jgi:hypothetical protein
LELLAACSESYRVFGLYVGTNVELRWERLMGRKLAGTAAATVVAVSIFASTAALADKGCKNIQSKCAIEIGGRCDPVSGHWEYGQNGAGGTTQAHNACISRAQQKK